MYTGGGSPGHTPDRPRIRISRTEPTSSLSTHRLTRKRRNGPWCPDTAADSEEATARCYWHRCKTHTISMLRDGGI